MNSPVLKSYYCNKRSEEHTSELQSHLNLVCRLLLAKKNKVSPESIEHIDLTTASFCAEVVRATGGVVNIITNSGSIFFFKTAAPTEINPVPHPAAFPI